MLTTFKVQPYDYKSQAFLLEPCKTNIILGGVGEYYLQSGHTLSKFINNQTINSTHNQWASNQFLPQPQSAIRGTLMLHADSISSTTSFCSCSFSSG